MFITFPVRVLSVLIVDIINAKGPYGRKASDQMCHPFWIFYS